MQQKGDLSLWTVLHVRDDSQLSFVSSLPPPSPSRLTRRRILPNPYYGLGGRTLKLIIKPVISLIILSLICFLFLFVVCLFFGPEAYKKRNS